MKKNNKNKGFTLIELLAVVVILLTISVMAVSSISSAIERNKAKQNETKKKVLASYAEAYYDEHKNTVGNKRYIELGQLGLTDEEKKDADGNDFTGCVVLDDGQWKYTDDRSKCQ